jgi:PAS domain S-box-containing protein
VVGTAEEVEASCPVDAGELLEIIGNAVLALDRDLVIKWANNLALAFLGLSSREVLERSICAAFPQMARREIQAFREVLANGKCQRFETTWPPSTAPLNVEVHWTGRYLLIYFRDASMRRRTEMELRERRELLELAESSAGIGIWDIDLENQVVRGTDQFFAIMGLAPAERAVPMETIRSLRHAEDRERVSEGFQRAVDSGTGYFEVEYRVTLPDDRTRWIFGRGRVVRDTAGVAIRYSGVDIDITDKKTAESALRESEERFRRVFEQSPVGKAMAGPDFRLRAVNPALCKMLGYEAHELVGRRFTDFVHPADLERCVGAGHALLAGTIPQIEMEERFIRKSGQPLWVRVIVGPIHDANGKLLHTLGILQDIDEHRRVLQQLTDSEDRLRKLNETLERQAEERALQLASSRAQLQAFFDNSPDWLTLQRATPEGKFIYVDINPTCEAAYGLRRDQVIGRPVEDILGFAAAQTPIGSFRKCLLTGEPQRYITHRTMAGVTRTIDVMSVLVPSFVGPDGSRFIITTARDITEREQMEAQLRQAQKMEAVGHLTGGIAHDFNNLLTGISGNLELLERQIAGGGIQDAGRLVSAAMNGTNRAAALTHRLLAFARRQPLDPKPLDANLLIGSMDDLLRRTLGPSIDLRMMLKEALWATLCDHNQLENEILNLAINARDAMQDGGHLVVETGNIQIDEGYAKSQGDEVQAGDYVTVSMTDTGCGMPPDIVAKVFEPFFTTKPLGRGTGLGLSMLYGFVKQSGGHVRIYSEVGEGTTVRLYLPRYGDDDASDLSVHSPPAVQKRHRRAEAGETVLVIEDEEPIRELINRALTELGYAVIEAPDGPAGLRILDSDHRIDLLVTDVGLPAGLNGRQVADAARERRSGLKVLFITGFAYSSALARGSALDPGMEIMTKPFTLDAFTSKIGEMVPKAPASEEPVVAKRPPLWTTSW